MKKWITVLALILGSSAWASSSNRPYCITFETGSASNSCGEDLDITWCHSDSLSKCTDSWKTSYVLAQGKSTVDYDRDDAGLFALVYACTRDDDECLDARNEYREKNSR